MECSRTYSDSHLGTVREEEAIQKVAPQKIKPKPEKLLLICIRQSAWALTCTSVGKTLSKSYGSKWVFSGTENMQKFTESKNRAYKEKSATLRMDIQGVKNPIVQNILLFCSLSRIFSLPPHLIYFTYKQFPSPPEEDFTLQVACIFNMLYTPQNYVDKELLDFQSGCQEICDNKPTQLLSRPGK